MIVSEFIEWLKTQDQDAIVQIVMHFTGSSYYEQSGYITIKDFDPHNANHFYHVNFKGNPHVSEDQPHFNKSYLTLGTTDN